MRGLPLALRQKEYQLLFYPANIVEPQADPVITIFIMNGSFGTILKVGNLVKQLYLIGKQLKIPELTLISIVAECEIV